MKKHIVAFLVILSFFAGVNITQERKKIYWDGYDWETHKGDKLIGLTYLEGIQHGSLVGVRSVIALLRTKYHWDETKLLEIASDDTSDIYLFGATYGQMYDGINEFYADYANKRVPVYALATLACRRVSGKLDQREVEKELLRLRLEFSE